MKAEPQLVMAPLHVETTGSGTDLVLLHGWGMHGGYWHELAGTLSEHYRVHVVDLPGHGYSSYAGETNLNEFVTRIITSLQDKVQGAFMLAGWSLGGLIAQAMCRQHASQISHLVLIASSPAFMQGEGWQSAMPEAVLQAFADDLSNDYQATLKRFIALQVRGGEQQQQSLRELRQQLFSRGEPDMAALQAGLELLRSTDLRRELATLQQPICLLAGERDTLVPANVCAALQELSPTIVIECIAKAGHAPFLSHHKQCLATIRRFLDHD